MKGVVRSVCSEPLRIGTRSSLLAQTQTQWVANQLASKGIHVELQVVETKGDMQRDTPITKIGGDGVFVRELEQALLDHRIDIAVHSMKDLPTAETPGLVIPCVPQRATPYDVFVGRTKPTLQELPSGSVVGTSSIRRVVQLKGLRKDLVIQPIRGNVDTRLKKLDSGKYDGLILAGAGLERLDLADRITQFLKPPLFAPAIAQGALAVQTREDDRFVRERILPISHEATHESVLAERACLQTLAGGCLAPIAGWGRKDSNNNVSLDAWVFEDCGEEIVSIHASGIADPSTESPRQLGERVATSLIDKGATSMLERIREPPNE